MNEVVAASGIKSGGTLNETMYELETSGFIKSYLPFGKKKKETLYRLIDDFSMFYLHFMENAQSLEALNWQQLNQLPAWKSWSGFAFENVCLRHVKKVKEALQIAGIVSRDYSFVARATVLNPGVQIDLLIDRNDQTINLCEMKFYNGPYVVTKEYADELRRKRSVFNSLTATRKQVFITLVTTYGVQINKNSIGLIDNEITIDQLF